MGKYDFFWKQYTFIELNEKWVSQTFHPIPLTLRLLKYSFYYNLLYCLKKFMKYNFCSRYLHLLNYIISNFGRRGVEKKPNWVLRGITKFSLNWVSQGFCLRFIWFKIVEFWQYMSVVTSFITFVDHFPHSLLPFSTPH